MFITIKSGSSGPMQEVDQGDRQAENMRYWLGLSYVDLYLMHEGDLGTTGHHPSAFCDYPTTASCRQRVFQSCLDWMKKGKTRACGVANWELEWLQELKDANVTLPDVVQMKFHLHQSLASPRIKAIKDFCDENDIVFNGYSPLGRADWTVFGPEEGGTATLLEEPVVVEIAERIGRSPAQVLLAWNAQQGIPTNPRSMDPAHMQENIDVFNIKLSDDDMQRLSNMPQCTTLRGNAFMEGDPAGLGHDNMIGPTLHC
jgi:2,5-diketo-D-gluconate reductase A